MRCPSCNKFATYDTSAEPEMDLECEGGVITGTARIVLTSECCGDELKEGNFDADCDLTDTILDAVRDKAKADKIGMPPEDLTADGWEFDIREAPIAEITDRMEASKTKTLKSGKAVTRHIPYRYQKRFFGYAAQVTVTASYTPPEKAGEKETAAPPGKREPVITVEVEATLSDEVQASDMDELV